FNDPNFNLRDYLIEQSRKSKQAESKRGSIMLFPSFTKSRSKSLNEPEKRRSFLARLFMPGSSDQSKKEQQKAAAPSNEEKSVSIADDNSLTDITDFLNVSSRIW